MGKGISVRFLRSDIETKMLQQAELNKRRITLKKVLLQFMGLSLSREQPALKMEDIEFAGLGEELLVVSQSIGISPEEIPLTTDSVEIEVNGVAFALDGEMQFNKFRMQTLQSPVYALPLIPNLNRYEAYCQLSPFEATNLLGKKTKDRLPLERKVLPSEYNLRFQAMADFMQDLLPLVHYVPIIRLSVYDQLQTPTGIMSLHHLLQEDNPVHFRLLADYFTVKLESLEESFCLEYL